MRVRLYDSCVRARSLVRFLSRGRQPFSKGQKFIPLPRYASQRLFPGAVPLYVNAKTRSSFLVYFVSMPWQCDITLRNRFPAGHFLRRHVDAKPFPRDYCVADFNVSTCILRFAFGNEMCVNTRLKWSLVQRNTKLIVIFSRVYCVSQKSSLLKINFYNFNSNKSNHFISDRK